jgi:Transcriptional regulatory protein, C terminal
MSQVHRRNISCAIIQFCKEAYSPQVIANHYHDGCCPSRIEAAGMDEVLMRNRGLLMTRTILLERVWDFRFDPKSSIVETHVSRRRLRSAAGRNVLYASSWLKPGERRRLAT